MMSSHTTSPATAIVPQRPRRVWPWILGGGALCLALGLVLLILWAMNQRSQSARRLEVALAKIRQEGGPTTAAELEAFYVVPPPDKDATQLWLVGATAGFHADARSLPFVGDGDLKIPPPGEPWNELAAVERFLAQHAASLAKLHEAADLGGAARYPTQFKLGFSMPTPHLNSLRTGYRLLSLEAHTRAHRQDARGAAQSLRAIVRLSESLKNEPLLVSQLVRTACASVASERLKELLPHVKFADEDLARLQTELRAMRMETGLQQALQGERVMSLLTFEDPSGLGGGNSWLMRWSFLSPEAAGIQMESLTAQIEAAARPWPAALLSAKQAQQELRADAAGASRLRKSKYQMAEMTGPNTEAAFVAVGRALARRDATDAALAVERYRMRHDRLPQQLADLVPDLLQSVPLDPFDGRPLRLIVRANEYVIYNVGADGIDNLGVGDASGKPDDPFVVPILSPRP